MKFFSTSVRLKDENNSDLFRQFKTSILKENDDIAVKLSYTNIEEFCYFLKHEIARQKVVLDSRKNTLTRV